VVAVVAVLSLSGCSFFMRGPQSRDPRVDPDCTESLAPPVLDGVGTVLMGVATVALIAAARQSCNQSDPDVCNFGRALASLTVIPVGGATLTYGVSTGVGVVRSRSCREARAAHQQWLLTSPPAGPAAAVTPP